MGRKQAINSGKVLVQHESESVFAKVMSSCLLVNLDVTTTDTNADYAIFRGNIDKSTTFKRIVAMGFTPLDLTNKLDIRILNVVASSMMLLPARVKETNIGVLGSQFVMCYKNSLLEHFTEIPPASKYTLVSRSPKCISAKIENIASTDSVSIKSRVHVYDQEESGASGDYIVQNIDKNTNVATLCDSVQVEAEIFDKKYIRGVFAGLVPGDIVYNGKCYGRVASVENDAFVGNVTTCGEIENIKIFPGEYSCYGGDPLRSVPDQCPGAWSRPCKHDSDCPFFGGSNLHGGCKANGACEMPLGVKNMTHILPDTSTRPVCVDCGGGDAFCCGEQAPPKYAF
jgi:hypothetical protein